MHSLESNQLDPIRTISHRQFINEKNQCLRKSDRSLKGSLDKPIELLVTAINQSDNFYTTSSCSGRIVLVSSEPKKLKSQNQLIFVSHTIIEESENLLQILTNPTTNFQLVTLKFESFILHIRCKSLEYARTLLRCSIDAGQRNSGLNISNSGHITVAIRNTLDLEVPLIINNKLMVSEDYLRELITIANEKLISNFEMIQRFFDVCEQNDLFRSLE